MKFNKTFFYGVALIFVGVFGWIVFSIYLMSYEDKGIPQDVPLWTVVDMGIYEWVIYILGTYVTTLMLISGVVICIWSLVKLAIK